MLIMSSRALWIGIEMGRFFAPPFTNTPRFYSSYLLMGITMRRVFGIFWKCARIGERLSPYVSLCCIVMAVSLPSMKVWGGAG